MPESKEEYDARFREHYQLAVRGPLDAAKTAEEKAAIREPLMAWLKAHQVDYLDHEFREGRAKKWVNAALKQLQALVSLDRISPDNFLNCT